MKSKSKASFFKELIDEAEYIDYDRRYDDGDIQSTISLQLKGYKDSDNCWFRREVWKYNGLIPVSHSDGNEYMISKKQFNKTKSILSNAKYDDEELKLEGLINDKGKIYDDIDLKAVSIIINVYDNNVDMQLDFNASVNGVSEHYRENLKILNYGEIKSYLKNVDEEIQIENDLKY